MKTRNLLSIVSFTIVLLQTFLSSAQNTNYTTIDEYVRNAPKNLNNLTKLSYYLGKEEYSDIEKVRAFYVWIAENISYDTKAYFSNTINGDKITAESTLKQGKAVCQGYSELFKALCETHNIPCFIVSGYSKGYGYSTPKNFTNTDHAWNAVKIENQWYLTDVTWAAGHVNDKKKFVPLFQEQFFLPPPNEFILKHLPADPMWQLLPCPVSINLFKQKDEFILEYLAKDENCFNFKDTLSQFETLSRVEQMVNSADRAYRFNPKNHEVTGFAYLNLAYELSLGMEELYNTRQYNKALSINNEILLLNKKALSYLKKSKSEQAKSAASVCNDNIKSIENNIKGLKKIVNQ